MAEIIAKNGEFILVDDEDFGWLSAYNWHVAAVGYPRVSIGKDKFYMHRLILGLSLSDERQVDHANGDKLDNRRMNLRICTSAENIRNRGAHRNNVLGLKGVYFHKGAGKYLAQIMCNRKRFNLGLHETPELAHEMYCLAADMLHGEFANHGAK